MQTYQTLLQENIKDPYLLMQTLVQEKSIDTC
jgi:hypothetical protein